MMRMNRRQCHHTRRLNIGLNEAEYAHLLENFAKTTCDTLSDYGRRMLLTEPVVVRIRNRSTDAMTAELAAIRSELEAAGKSFSAAITGAQMLQPPHRYLILHIEKEILCNKIAEVESCIQKIAEACLL